MKNGMPERIRRYRTRGWRLPVDNVSVVRVATCRHRWIKLAGVTLHGWKRQCAKCFTKTRMK